MKFFLVILFLGLALAQDLIPTNAKFSKSGFVTTVIYQGQSYQHIDGIGWINSPLEFKIIGDRVFLVNDKSTNPRLKNIRYGVFRNRIVLDIPELEADQLRYLEAQGIIKEDEILEIALPKLDFAQDLIKDYKFFNQELVNDEVHTVYKIFGASFSYKIFVLSQPSRLVIDFEQVFVPQDKDLGHGVRYKKFLFETEERVSTVNLLEISPNYGHFEVVGQNYHADKISNLSAGAFAAINAGYFDPQNHDSIGYLKIADRTLSMPSRNRAVAAFGNNELLIDRLSTETAIYINDNYFYAALSGNVSDIMLYPIAKRQIDDENRAKIVVRDGRVVSHGFDAVSVPEDGFVISYNPIVPGLLEVKLGDRAGYEIKYQPKRFLNYPYAIEAGPLLLKDYQNVYQPGLEHFQIGQKILDSYTDQAAIGVREDGTVILLSADNMTAGDLIPLLESLDLKDAMRLDSGSSATLYADGKVLNRIFSRKLVTAIVFIPTQ